MLTRLLEELRQSGKDLAQEVSRVDELESQNDAWLKDNPLTPLMAAAYFGHGQLMTLLMSVGAKVDQVNPIGQTALMCAARSGHTAAVQALLRAGAEVNLVCNRNTALKYAEEIGHTAIVQVLLQAGAGLRRIPVMMSD